MATFNWGVSNAYDDELKLIRTREEFICDSREDIQALDTEKLLSGSLALCVREATIFALDSESTWYSTKDPTDTISGGKPAPGSLTITINPSTIKFVNGETGYADVTVTGTIPEDYGVNMSIQSEEEPYSSISDHGTDYVKIQANGTGTTDSLLVTIDDGMGDVLASATAQIIVTA